MNSTRLPFNPVDRNTLGGCAPSPKSCALLGGVLIIVVILILGGAGATAYFLARPKEGAAPGVEITAPANGSEVAVDSPLLVVASAAAPEGVKRLELWQGGQQINGVGITSEPGLTQLTASLRWLPPAPGKFTLEVRAYDRSDEVSALALVTVIVVGNRPAPLMAPAGSTVLAIEPTSPAVTVTAAPEPTATKIPTSTPEPTVTPVPTNPPAPPQSAGEPNQGQPGGPGGQLPQEAITACSSLSEGDSCTASGPMGDVTGTCVTLDNQLACMPAGGPPGRQ